MKVEYIYYSFCGTTRCKHVSVLEIILLNMFFECMTIFTEISVLELFYRIRDTESTEVLDVPVSWNVQFNYFRPHRPAQKFVNVLSQFYFRQSAFHFNLEIKTINFAITRISHVKFFTLVDESTLILNDCTFIFTLTLPHTFVFSMVIAETRFSFTEIRNLRRICKYQMVKLTGTRLTVTNFVKWFAVVTSHLYLRNIGTGMISGR